MTMRLVGCWKCPRLFGLLVSREVILSHFSTSGTLTSSQTHSRSDLSCPPQRPSRSAVHTRGAVPNALLCPITAWAQGTRGCRGHVVRTEHFQQHRTGRGPPIALTCKALLGMMKLLPNRAARRTMCLLLVTLRRT